MTVRIDRLAVIGVGLIGGSFALALKEAGAVGFVTGCGRSRENLEAALEMGIADDVTVSPAEAVAGADVVMLAVPVRSIALLCRRISPFLKPRAIVTDAGSTKEIVLGEMFAHLPLNARPVAGHPIAGKETAGARAADANLFKGRVTILTPDKTTDPQALETVKQLWTAAGSRVEMMPPSVHDRVLGAVSHLPHMVAYALISALMAWDREQPMLRFSAGGLKDFTRIAASSPEMWRDICVDNKPAIIEAIDRFAKSLAHLRSLIESGDGRALEDLFESCKKVREGLKREEG